jgi:hypothetical protein
MGQLKMVSLSVDWFIDNLDSYITREELIEYQELIGIRYKDIVNRNMINQIADKICIHSSIFWEIRRAKGGAFFPEKVYRKDANYFNRAPNQIDRADDIIMFRPMCYSVNARFESLRHCIIPYVIDTRLRNSDGITIGNLGSGLGRDVYPAMQLYNCMIKRVVNLDIDEDAISYGRKEIPIELKEKVAFYNCNLACSNPEGNSYDLVLLIGIICPLTDESAIRLLRIVNKNMAKKSSIIVSTSSTKMRSDDPLGSINIQITAQWALNCRNEQQLVNLLSESGFSNIEVLREPLGYNLIAVGSK